MNAPPALGLYVHIPFCERKCPYCDFNTYAGLQPLHQEMVDALCAEMERWRLPLAGREVATVFIGGGTPTLLTEAQLAQLFGAMHANFRLAEGCEITCEANPGTVDRAKFGALRALGVNRLSMGVQSFQEQELGFLGRIHDAADVYSAYAAARAAGFDNINLDFIFGLPHQQIKDWEDTLDRALELAPEHLSLYSLIVEPNTPLYHWVEVGQVDAPDDDLAADLYEMAMAKLSAGGYVQYEVSNWARTEAAGLSAGPAPTPGASPSAGGGDGGETPTYACRHNLIYWRNDDYLGVGPGAHSHLRSLSETGEPLERRWGNRKPPGGYVKRLRAGQGVEEFSETIDPRLAMGETMMLGLRLLREGVQRDRFAQRHGQEVESVFSRELQELAQRRLLLQEQQQIRLSPEGLLLGNQVFAAFLPD
jgi:oxygen-independent coproporphyrinogen-3 oxidase